MRKECCHCKNPIDNIYWYATSIEKYAHSRTINLHSMNDFIRRSINQVITSAMSVNPSAFSALNDRLLKAGKVPHSDLASLGKSSTISKGMMNSEMFAVSDCDLQSLFT